VAGVLLATREGPRAQTKVGRRSCWWVCSWLTTREGPQAQTEVPTGWVLCGCAWGSSLDEERLRRGPHDSTSSFAALRAMGHPCSQCIPVQGKTRNDACRALEPASEAPRYLCALCYLMRLKEVFKASVSSRRKRRRTAGPQVEDNELPSLIDSEIAKTVEKSLLSSSPKHNWQVLNSALQACGLDGEVSMSIKDARNMRASTKRDLQNATSKLRSHTNSPTVIHRPSLRVGGTCCPPPPAWFWWLIFSRTC
jgi:hypothetical protein